MTDINEMRRLVQDANQEMWVFWHGIVATDVDSDGAVVVAERPTPSGGKYQARVDARLKFIAAANPAAISELIDRLEAAESDAAHQKALADSALRVAEVWEEKCNSLRAKIAEMERQEPICRAEDLKHAESLLPTLGLKPENPLYAIPGAQAQPAPSIPDDVMRDAKRYRFLRAAKNIPISTEAARDPIVYDAAIDAAMLAAAQEAKP